MGGIEELDLSLLPIIKSGCVLKNSMLDSNKARQLDSSYSIPPIFSF